MSNKSKRFPPEFRERAARMVLEEEKNHPSRWSAVMMIAPKLDIHPDTLSKWTRVHERANAPAVNDLPDAYEQQLYGENADQNTQGWLKGNLQNERSLSDIRWEDAH